MEKTANATNVHTNLTEEQAQERIEKIKKLARRIFNGEVVSETVELHHAMFSNDAKEACLVTVNNRTGEYQELYLDIPTVLVLGDFVRTCLKETVDGFVFTDRIDQEPPSPKIDDDDDLPEGFIRMPQRRAV